MAIRSRACSKCQGTMSEGFIMDGQDHGSRKVSRWIEGAPEKRWFGLKVRGKLQFEMQTFRCSRCGYLESYALPE